MKRFFINRGPNAPYRAQAAQPRAMCDYIHVEDRNGHLVGSVTIDHNERTVDVVTRTQIDDFFETTQPYGNRNFNPVFVASWLVDQSDLQCDTPIPLT